MPAMKYFRRHPSDLGPTLIALVAGLVVTLGLPPVPGTGLLVPVGLAGLFGALHAASRPGRTLWVFALAHQTTLLHWLFFLIPAKTIPTRVLVPIQAIATILYVSAFYALLGWLWGLLRRRMGPYPALLVLPVLWTGMEAARAQGEMAFPWCLSGSAVLGTPLMPLLAATGEIGLSALLAFLGAAGALLWIWRRRDETARPAALWALAGAALLGGGLVLGAGLKPVPVKGPAGVREVPLREIPLRVSAVQADVSLDDKWQPALIDSSRIPYRKLTLEAAAEGADLVVWAETAVPAYVRHDRRQLAWLREVIHEAGVAVFTGFPDAQQGLDGSLLRYNGSGLFSAQGRLQDRYMKHHLLPIGEAMPFTRYFPALAKLDVGQAEWAPGAPPEAITLQTDAGGFPFSGLICFESILAAQARDSVRRGSRCLMVLTNDGWFGQTAGPRQHSALARLRAAECRVPMVRCANNGISFISDSSGRLLARLGLGRRGWISAAIAPGSGATAYVRWGAWPLCWGLLVWSALVLWRGRRWA
ncbi:MAG: apolipoprotein N-acyltransferase [Deltaproteobacteria bacterium]|nr:MAG: apolipoprotein N-acyltransferase [Deltaproteobacteria bacterium]